MYSGSGGIPKQIKSSTFMMTLNGISGTVVGEPIELPMITITCTRGGPLILVGTNSDLKKKTDLYGTP